MFRFNHSPLCLPFPVETEVASGEQKAVQAFCKLTLVEHAYTSNIEPTSQHQEHQMSIADGDICCHIIIWLFEIECFGIVGRRSQCIQSVVTNTLTSLFSNASSCLLS